MTDLTNQFERAFAYCVDLHREQTRKDTDVPYVSHLMAVSGLVLEAGGSEDQAIAALLHDALEDQPDKTSAEDIADRFGDEVARIVVGCSDVAPGEISESGGKPPWRFRKERYLEHLGDADEAVLLVSCADKLHNARAILRDFRISGDGLWDRFNADADEQLRYQRSLADVFSRRLDHWLATELDLVVRELETQVVGG